MGDSGEQQLKMKPDTQQIAKDVNSSAIKAQPWKAFINEPDIRPFSSEKGTGSVIRLRVEKDEHGLGG